MSMAAGDQLSSDLSELESDDFSDICDVFEEPSLSPPTPITRQLTPKVIKKNKTVENLWSISASADEKKKRTKSANSTLQKGQSKLKLPVQKKRKRQDQLPDVTEPKKSASKAAIGIARTKKSSKTSACSGQKKSTNNPNRTVSPDSGVIVPSSSISRIDRPRRSTSQKRYQLPDLSPSPSPPISSTSADTEPPKLSSQEYEFEVLDMRMHRGKKQFKVKWLGFQEIEWIGIENPDIFNGPEARLFELKFNFNTAFPAQKLVRSLDDSSLSTGWRSICHCRREKLFVTVVDA